MPTYSYACTACGHRFDAQQSFADAALTECPECAGRLRKLFGNVGVVFKGPGFYRTDARAAAKHGRGGSKRPAASAGSSSGSSESSPSTPSTPATPATPASTGSSGTSTASGKPAAASA